MSFLHPEFLYYMLPPLFILFGLLLTQKESQATFFSQEVMKKLRVSANTLTLQARNGLFMLIALLMVIALSGPVIDDGKVEIKAKSADIMIALDISDSMLAEDVYPNRLKLAKQKALELLRLAPNERVGVIAFAKNSYLVSPLSFDHGAVGFLLRQLDTKSITEKGTNLLSMLEVVDGSVKKESKKYLLILSDGGDSSDFSTEIEFAKEKGIAVFVLGIGTTKGAPIKQDNGSFITENGTIIISKLNENISDLATATGGVYIESLNSDADVKAMLREIEAHSEKKELKSQEIARYIPLFYYPIGMALFLLLIATSSMSKREKIQLPSVFILAAFMFVTSDVNAGLFDFVELDKAKEAYEQKDYKRSQEIYEKYADKTKKADTHYNIANSLYKQSKYKEAIASYKKASFEDRASRAKNLSNMGNAYVKEGAEKSLNNAQKAYERSLEQEENKETRENLEAVKKAIEEQKKKEQKDKDKKKDKNKKDDKKKEDKKEGSDKKEDSEKKGDKSEDKDKKSKDSKDKQKESDEEKKKEKSDEEKAKQEQEKKKDEAKELKDEKDKNGDSKQKPSQQKKSIMSEEEAQKWLKQLNKEQNTYLYQLNKNKQMQEQTYEKPW